MCGVETAIAFAGEKELFLVRFLVAEVLSVSRLAVQGRALVMVVSRWSASVVAEVSLVSTSSRHSCLCAKKFALRGQNGTNSAFYGLLGEFCRVCRHGSHVSQVRRRPTCRKWWGVLHDMKPSGCVSPACRSLMSCNSPDWCLSVRGAVPKVQTVAAKNVEEGLPRFVLAGTRAD